MRYSIYTLDGDEILKSFYVRYYDLDEADYDYEKILFWQGKKIRFDVDLSNTYGKMRYIKKYDFDDNMRDDNAYFYQIRKSYGLEDRNPECLLHTVVIVEFGRYFKNLNREDLREVADSRDQIDYEERAGNFYPRINDYEDISEEIEPDVHGKKELDELRTEDEEKRDAVHTLFEQGFYVKFDDDSEVHFIQGLKSASMARKNRICFIRQNRDGEKGPLSDLTERLDLGMHIREEEGIIAKTEAYYGLYLTSGTRIEGLEMNEKTVIVIPDKCITQNTDIITYDYNSENDAYNLENDKKNVNINPFDGEGIISFDMAEKIDKIYRYRKDPIGLSSFQIRMPFIKGMLHKVDFLRFLKENLPNCEHKIKDYFGIIRDLDFAKVILTESMFKQCKALKALMKSDEDVLKDYGHDPMKYFFHMFNKYDHAMYVSNTEEPYIGRSLISLNYQFLSTLSPKFSDKVKIMEYLLNGHKEYVKDPIKYLKRYADIWDNEENADGSKNEETYSYYYYEDDESLEETVSDDVNQEYDDLDEDQSDDSGKENTDDKNTSLSNCAWIHAVMKNRAFTNDEYIKQELKNKSEKLKKLLIPGRILVDGEIRFLSGDLLYFLRDLIEMSLKTGEKNDDRTTEILTEIDDELLKQDEMYMPNTRSESEYVPVLRSPHLSKYENCVLRIRNYRHKKEKTREIIRDKYLGHLKGCLMIAHDSMAHMIMGGADYDGDLVKVIYNNKYRDAVLATAYEKKDGTKEYKRKLPIVNIPKVETQKLSQYGSTPNFIIRDTFLNNVGKISNLAITMNQVLDDLGEPTLKEIAKELNMEIPDTAECTLLTGMDIDAVKTGKRPQQKIDDLEKYITKAGNKLNMKYVEIVSNYKKRKAGKSFRFNEFVKNQEKEQKNREKNNEYVPSENMLDVMTSKIYKIPADKDWMLNEAPKKKIPFVFINKKKKLADKKEMSLKNLMDIYCLEKSYVDYALRNYKGLKAKYEYYSRYIMEICIKQEKPEKSGHDTDAFFEFIDKLGWQNDKIREKINILEDRKCEWPYLINEEEKKTFLCSYFEINKKELDDKGLSNIFSDFTSRGYCLLYFYMRLFLNLSLLSEFSLYDSITHYYSTRKDGDSSEEPKWLLTVNDYQELTKKLTKGEITPSKIKEEINRKYSEEVESFFIDSPKDKVKYLYTVAGNYKDDTKRPENKADKTKKDRLNKYHLIVLEFFWKNVTPKEIDENIIVSDD